MRIAQRPEALAKLIVAELLDKVDPRPDSIGYTISAHRMFFGVNVEGYKRVGFRFVSEVLFDFFWHRFLGGPVGNKAEHWSMAPVHADIVRGAPSHIISRAWTGFFMTVYNESTTPSLADIEAAPFLPGRCGGRGRADVQVWERACECLRGRRCVRARGRNPFTMYASNIILPACAHHSRPSCPPHSPRSLVYHWHNRCDESGLVRMHSCGSRKTARTLPPPPPPRQHRYDMGLPPGTWPDVLNRRFARMAREKICVPL